MKTVLILIAVTMVAATVCNAGAKTADGYEGDHIGWRADSSMAGKPVDIAPWTYMWRADRAVQEKPEAYFIPRRLDRIDKVYRTAHDALPEDKLKSIYYNMPDLLTPLLPQPKGRMLAGLLWTGGLVDYRVELHWPADVGAIPSPEAMEVRVYPSSFGWFGWTVDKVLSGPEISRDRRMWTYMSDPTAKMDSGYSARVPAATEMVAVFHEDDRPGAKSLFQNQAGWTRRLRHPSTGSGCSPKQRNGLPRSGFETGSKSIVPTIRVVGPSLGVWKRMDVEIEWGFQAGKKRDFDGRLEPYMAMIGPVAPLAGDKGTTMTGEHKWRSRVAGDNARRGIVVPLLYSPDSRPGLDSRITIWSEKAGFTFRVSDLDNGPIYIPEHGVFVTKAGSGQTARQFVKELSTKNLKSVRQMTREHREAGSWEELMQEVRLWTRPEGTAPPPFPKVRDPAMDVQLSDERWTDAWRAASNQLRGKHMWGGLAFEVGRVAHEMDMVGLHEEADKVYEHFLKVPGAKSDGDYTDGDGALEWATSMRHDMGYSHDGTHASTGRLLFAMAERYFLTGDREWFQRNRVRLQAAADWIIRQRTLYMKDIPNRKDIFVAGLMPPCMLGDYAIPSCDWHWYYVDNALSVQGLQRFSDALMEFDPKAGRKYRKEANAFHKDLRRAVEREAALSPVRLGRDGMYRSYIPRMAYARGLTGPELGAPQFPDCDLFVGALPLAEPFAALDAGDFRMVDTLDVMEELGTSVSAVREREEARKKKGHPTDDAWFWHPYVILPKASHNANIYLLQDDAPNFLRYWMNSYASMVGADGKLWEHWHLGSYDECSAPDNGTAGWFIDNFRNMLVMEEGRSLWLARATPRSWLQQGKRIAVRNAPTYFGTLAYEIVSDVDNGTITATIEVPDRNPVGSMILRLRHPDAAPIRGVTVNGRPWKGFKPDNEIIKLTGLTGKVAVVANY
ncbi:MAG: hypothetical protein HYX78_14220 [Armatimonadetes bacterium]|nr:hypothetical protein [Armatimonadota bacterium]